MKASRTATATGTFVLSALILTMVGFLLFGGRAMFAEKARFVTFFGESVKGLGIGSTVRFKGIPIGRVVSIKIRPPGDTSSRGITVFYELDVQRLEEELGVMEDIQSLEVYEDSLLNGLSAALEADSIVTGLLSIAIDFRSEQTREDLAGIRLDLFEIPAAPSSLASIQASVTSIIDNLSAVDFQRLAASTTELVEQLRDTIERVDTATLSEESIALVREVRALLAGDDVRELLVEARESLAAVRELSTNLEGQADRFAPDLAASLSSFNETLASLAILSSELTRNLRPESELYQDTKNAIREFEITLRSLRQLIQYLETNPNALISGRND